MNELRDLLELLYLARSRWRTARLTMDDWTHLDRQQDAYERALGLEGTSEPHAWGPIAATSRTWLHADGRFRQEREPMTLDPRRHADLARDARERRDRARVAVDAADRRRALRSRRRSCRASTSSSRARRWRRAGWRSRSPPTPRPRGAGPIDLFPYGADALSLAVDRERGVDPPVRGERRGRADSPARGDGDRVRRGAGGRALHGARRRHSLRPRRVSRCGTSRSNRRRAMSPFQLWAPARLAGRWTSTSSTAPRRPARASRRACCCCSTTASRCTTSASRRRPSSCSPGARAEPAR